MFVTHHNLLYPDPRAGRVKMPREKRQDSANMKKDGGLIRNWQLHHLTLPDIDGLEEMFKAAFPGVLLDPGPLKFSGTVVEDSAGRYKPGWHMISSYICSMDRARGIIETMNTIYKVIDEGNDELPDMGNHILNVFY